MKPPRFALLPPAVCLCWLSVPAVARAADTVESVAKAAQDCVRIRVETVRLESDWKVQKELLESTVAALGERAQTTEAKRDDLKARTATDRTELADVQAKNNAATEGLKATDARLNELQARLLRLRPSLPPRLSEALELSYRSLAEEKGGPSERMQVIMTILNRCAQFNRTVTSDVEILNLPGEPRPKSLPVLYWGLSHAYTLDRATGRAWLGVPGPNGWQWAAQPGAADAVAALLAVHNDKAEPTFVAVPARLAHPAGATSTPAHP